MVDITDPPSVPPPASPTTQNDTTENTPSLSPPPGASPDRDVGPHEASNAKAKAPDSGSGPAADMKKTYLSLLPPDQIIEICLLFETYVPPSVKTAAWPTDLQAAINDLKKTASLDQSRSPSHPQHNGQTVTPQTNGASHPSSPNAPPTHQVHPPGYCAPSLPLLGHPIEEDPPMGSLRDPAEEAKEREEREKAKASASASTTTSHAPSPVPHTNGELSTAATAQTGTSQPGQSQHATLHPPAPYPYAHYGYAVPPQGGQQPAYPHAPYYPPPHAYTSHYPYPHYPHQPPTGYPPQPPGHSSPPPPSGQQPLFNSQPLVRPPVHPPAPPQPPPPSGEDLPSYEEMIVEALVDCGDAEGAAPKDLFTWMASRYPLQTNFRPSASQALQKAYKRGRLEKMSGGKYRLNANWEGGATSKRTTRRPQTLAQTTYAMHHPPQQSSPFTHAPLQQHNHNNNQPPKGQPSSHYPGYQYQYPYGHYPGYSQQSQPAAEKPSAPAAASAPTPAENTASAKAGEDKDEGDAWEAAQHILQAINFNNLAGEGASADRPDSSSGAVPSSSAVDDLHAALAALTNAAAAAAAAEAQAEAPRTTLTDDERASLQAQLALLAAQLTEIAEAAEEQEESPVLTVSAQPEHSHPAPNPQPTPAPAPTPTKTVELPPPPIAAFSGAHLVLDINAFPEVFEPSTPVNASAAQTDVDELAGESSEDDDDMEDVIVPLQGHNALWT
ncbi:transcription factor [Ganoderma sinense ZZ0214-1]|uniref:Histone H1 n=1 Tax=Ganoderma sinense ZZ0214-1 TaxID=1077348 RepID=A0A2G8RLK4_9APHY|nr:transcription factor [Ganoderma sinense ZZ0214-1]